MTRELEGDSGISLVEIADFRDQQPEPAAAPVPARAWPRGPS